jgi:large subunit ribosomal protein L24e
MVEKRNCSFCGEPIEPGTGKMYVKKDGTVFNFCSNKCKKNTVDLERVSRRTRWTTRYAELKANALGKEAPGEEKAEEEPEPEKKPKKAAPKKAPAKKKEEATKEE